MKNGYDYIHTWLALNMLNRGFSLLTGVRFCCLVRVRGVELVMAFMARLSKRGCLKV